MSGYWNDRIANIDPYVPGEQPPDGIKLIKLNTNENPYPPSPNIRAAFNDPDSLRLYPDPSCTALRQTFAAAHGLDIAQVFATNSSDEILAFAFMSFWDKNRPLVAPALSYSFYPVYARLFDIPLTQIPMLDGIYIDIDRLCAEKGGVVLANPNAPTSVAIGSGDIIRILESHPNDVVLIDEAYADFAEESAMPLVNRYPNLLITRTMSKSYSLAGMRVGFAAGSPELIEGMNRTKNSFNSYTLDRIALEVARLAIEDAAHFGETVHKIKKTRASAAEKLRSLGFICPDSSTNFLFVTYPEKNAREIFERLREKNILVRYFNSPGLENYLRISIGTDEEMDAVAAALGEIISR